MATALLYNLNATDKGRKVRVALLKHGVTPRTVPSESFSIPIGGLLGIAGTGDDGEENIVGATCGRPPASTHQQSGEQSSPLRDAYLPMEGDMAPFSEEMLVFHDLRPGQLDAVLAELRGARVPVALKAMVTEHNVTWTAYTLRDHLMEERAAIARTRARGPVHGKA